MKTRSQSSFIAILALFCALFAAACKPMYATDSNSKNSSGANGNPSEVPGTGDPGGGTGVMGKIFESYIVDPMTLPAYKEHLVSLFANIEVDEEDDTGGPVWLFKMKSWFIAPVNLERINKDLIGVSFMKNETQQIARQTSKEVWIDKKIFDEMSTREQADLLLHEWVMNLYFIKFIKFSELCKVAKGTLPEAQAKEVDCEFTNISMDAILPPEPVRTLNDNDNSNIRFVTGWLLQNAHRKISKEEFDRVLYAHGFDKRMFRPGKNDQGEIKTTSSALVESVKAAELSNNMPDVCNGFVLGLSKPCKLKIEEIPTDFHNADGTPFDNFKVTVEIPGESTIEFSYLGGEMTLGSMTIGSSVQLYGGAVVHMVLNPKIGDRTYSAILLFEKTGFVEKNNLRFKSMVIIPSVIYAIDESKPNQTQCKSEKINPQTFSEDILIIRPDDKIIAEEQIYVQMDAYAACAKWNK